MPASGHAAWDADRFLATDQHEFGDLRSIGTSLPLAEIYEFVEPGGGRDRD